MVGWLVGDSAGASRKQARPKATLQLGSAAAVERPLLYRSHKPNCHDLEVAVRLSRHVGHLKVDFGYVHDVGEEAGGCFQHFVATPASDRPRRDPLRVRNCLFSM